MSPGSSTFHHEWVTVSPVAVYQFRSLVSIFYLNQLIYYLLHFTRILKTIRALKLLGQLFLSGTLKDDSLTIEAAKLPSSVIVQR